MGDADGLLLASYEIPLQRPIDEGPSATVTSRSSVQVGRPLEINDPAYAAYIDEVEVGERVAGRVRVAFGVEDCVGATDRLLEHGARLIACPDPDAVGLAQLAARRPRRSPADAVHRPLTSAADCARRPSVVRRASTADAVGSVREHRHSQRKDLVARPPATSVVAMSTSRLAAVGAVPAQASPIALTAAPGGVQLLKVCRPSGMISKGR